MINKFVQLARRWRLHCTGVRSARIPAFRRPVITIDRDCGLSLVHRPVGGTPLLPAP